MKKLQLLPAILLIGIALICGPRIAVGDPVPACCHAEQMNTSTANTLYVLLSIYLGIL